jgi:DNA-binding sugar fermentation-stimulating protein
MLYTIPGTLMRATVVKRPSAAIKSPYVADIRLDDGQVGLCHTPGLGCCGLVEAGRVIYVTAGRTGSKTSFTTHLAECNDETGLYYVGIHPMVSNSAARGLLSTISATATWASEVVVDDHTRLDYVGTLANGKKIYVEVKTAMVSKQCDVERCGRRAIFPEGYRKSMKETISPRAVKHAETLAALITKEDTEACILLFMIPRADCGAGMDINVRDETYYEAVSAAAAAGVQVRAFALDYALDSTVSLSKEVPVYLPPRRL